MKSRRRLLYAAFSGTAMVMLILDAETALISAREGVELCIRTVVPSLFPFILLSVLLTGNLFGSGIPLLRPIGKLCRIPKGAETLLLIGLLGGYPVGAQCITQAYRAGQLKKETAHRMLGFCSNAGPAFLFGMAASLFSTPVAAWVLWGIHILAALITGLLLPGSDDSDVSMASRASVSPVTALSQSLRAMANICGWVLVFRIVIGFCQRWFLWLLPEAAQIAVTGVLELTNGCYSLTSLQSEGLRFVLCGVFLGLGGVCVGMQTVSVTEGLGTGLYFPGKVVQGAISLLLAVFVQTLLFPPEQRMAIPLPALLCAAVIVAALILCLKNAKNSSSNLRFQGV